MLNVRHVVSLQAWFLLTHPSLNSAHYTVGLPVGIWLAFKMDLQLFGLWSGLGLAVGLAAGIGLYLCLTTDWYVEVGKAVARLSVDKRPIDEEHVP